MKFVKFALMGSGLLAAILAVSAGALRFGGHGIVVLVGCLLPVALGAWTISSKRGMPRAASIVSLLGLLVVGMKTSEGTLFENVMMLAVVGMACALLLAIKPDRPS
jgi:hypothetical protein